MYNLEFSDEASKILKKADKHTSKIILKKIKELRLNPELGIPLTAHLSGLWKLRIGKFRVIYSIKNQECLILIVRIGPRKNIYKR